MYKVSFRERDTDRVVMSFECGRPPTQSEMRELDFPCHECYMDICRLDGNPPLGDTANFRQEVEADLEPLED